MLFVPTVEVFQLRESWGRVPLWYAYVGVQIPDFFVVSIVFIFMHIVASVLISSYMAKRYSAWCPKAKSTIGNLLIRLDLWKG